MASAPPSPGCLSDIALRFSVESVQVVPGLLGAAVLVGIVLGAAAAAFLCFCLLLPRLSNKGKDPGVVLENSNSDIKRQDCRTESKNAIHPIRRKSLEEDNPFPSNGVAAFALKAKVVYPINQKFRPLADGASNPSLHESHKQTSLPNQMFEGSAYSSTESLSHGEKEDCSSSTTIHSITSEDRFYERTFPRVNSFLEVLTFSSCDVGLCLYSLCLQTLPLLDAELRREQHSMFLQILRINLTDLLLKKKIDGETFRNQLSAQEAELEELEERYRSRVTNTKMSRAHSSEFQTMEDIERREREYSDHLIQNTEGFWIQIEKVHQFLLDQAKCSYAEAEKIMMDLTSRMTVLETVLSESQELQAMEVQEKMIRWEHMAKVVDSLRHQIQEESECRLNAVSKTLDNLKNQKKISVRQKEHHLTELFKAFWEEVSQYNNECLQQTKSLISKLLTHRGKLIEILRRTQKEERLNFLSKAQGSSDPDSFIKEYHKLLEEQRELSCDLEDEEDCKALDSVADLCKELYTGASQNFEKLVKSLFLQTLPEMTDLSLQDCESLKLELRQHLSSELEKAEAERKAKIKVFQETLLQEKQLWAQEQVRSSALQNYVSEKEQQIIKEVLSRLSGINEESSRAAAQRHDFFLRCALRPLALRNIAMATLTQMRMSRKKIVLQELKEHRCLERSKSHCQDEEQWKMQNEMEIHILEEERKLEAETQQARTDCQQQLLSDLAEALHLIRQHMQRAIGQTLVHYAQQEAAKSMMEDNMDFKERLVEAAVESVYVSRNSVEKLLRRYNQTMGQILGEFQVAKKHQLKAVKDKLTTEKQKREKKSQKDELCAQPTYSDFLKRFFLQQNQLLEKCQLYQQIGLDSVRQRKSVQHRLFGDLENKLKDAEEEFIAELASLARICLTDGSYSSNNKAVPSESTRKNLSTKKHM
ncbi:hypothetical protein XENTR_v10000357 [Xenopus tropicalis]|uniref:Ellis-van Creveld syndrome protein n=1 Tax=Xenopus tropicalis TaxID=8364 RepID=A4IH32_XENTR|nr:evC complex member EVC [Xenopus tropicalis]AAI35353.1 evc protein [Xenopus tropicalis]KAE8629118.1 hypothetical protein XENTR_v10000357 [Xenopus tropicalis]|eukprot:NP_001096234.1 ellis-van Creveld syndrome protein [Xenopus tropicalis]